MHFFSPAPPLSSFCKLARRFIDFAYVECAIQKDDIAWQTGGDAMARMLNGIKYCSPVFVCCLGEMKGLKVNRKLISERRKNELIKNYPFLSSMIFDKEKIPTASTTDVELMEALYIPSMEAAMIKQERGVFAGAMVDGHQESYCEHKHFFTRHPSLCSVNFPEYMQVRIYPNHF